MGFLVARKPPHDFFLIYPNDTHTQVTGTDLHQPLKIVTFGNPLETNSGYTTAATFKDEKTGQIKHELIQYSVRTINNSQVSGITYPRKMHALYEKQL